MGSERILRMESTTNATDSFDVLLPSGSIYIQRFVAISTNPQSVTQQMIIPGAMFDLVINTPSYEMEHFLGDRS